MTDWLEEIEARADGATPEPWEMVGSPCYAEASVVAPCPCCGLIGNNMFHWDATFIAHARTDIPRLIARVRALEAQAETLVKKADGCCEHVAQVLSENEALRAQAERDGAVASQALKALTGTAIQHVVHQGQGWWWCLICHQYGKWPTDVRHSENCVFTALSALAARDARECPRCGQTDVGQTGEYACAACGLPIVWDDATREKGAE